MYKPEQTQLKLTPGQFTKPAAGSGNEIDLMATYRLSRLNAMHNLASLRGVSSSTTRYRMAG